MAVLGRFMIGDAERVVLGRGFVVGVCVVVEEPAEGALHDAAGREQRLVDAVQGRMRGEDDVFDCIVLMGDLRALQYTHLQQSLGVSVETEVFPAASDSRFLRQIGIPALGFSPMNNTEILLHEHNEFLHKDTFLRGIDVYETIFRKLFSHSS